MNLSATGTILRSALMALVVSAALGAGTASASPAWKFEGKALEGNETVIGSATLNMTIPGLTTSCESSLYMTISNSAGTAKGTVTKLSFENCLTDSKVCTVELIGAEQLPWPVRGVTVAPSYYVILEGIKIGIVYSGDECPISEIQVTVKGTAGGLFDNATSSITFSSLSFAATKTKLTAFGSSIEWKGVFPIKATGPHSGEELTLS
jgi:hypothetical protein